MQNRVGHTTDVLIDRHPLFGLFKIESDVVALRGQEAQEVPRAVDEGVHRVGVTLGRLGATRTGHIYPVRRAPQRRGALGAEVQAF